MASGLQLSRDKLLKPIGRCGSSARLRGQGARGFSAGGIPGFVHLYAGEEASGVGVCMHLDERTRSRPPIAATVIASPRAAISTA